MSIRDYLIAVLRGTEIPEALRFADALEAQDAEGLPSFVMQASLGWPGKAGKVLARWERMQESHLARLSKQRRREQTGLRILSP